MDYLRIVLVHVAHIFNLNADLYDEFLSQGWFRGFGMLYKSELLCVDQDVQSIVNIRVPLQQHRFSKKQTRLLRNFKRDFDILVGPVDINDEKQRLYDQHKYRFKAFIHPKLEDVICAYGAHEYCNTRELSVYHKDQLVALSYFDTGSKSMASILGLYDFTWSRFSPGMFTMYQEMEIAKQEGLSHYYPGYIMDESQTFHYKLRLGEVEFLKGRFWRPWKEFDPDQTAASYLRNRMQQLAEHLKSRGIHFVKRLYPFFSNGHMPESEEHALKYPVYFDWVGSQPKTVSTFDIESNEFLHLVLVPDEEDSSLSLSNFSSEYINNGIYDMRLWKIAEQESFQITPR